jgi:hypothetical protein
VLIACGLLLALTAPAAAHVRTAETHRDTRFELADVDIPETVETVEAAAGTEGEALPEQWCGTERTTDDTVNAAFPPEDPQFKVVYAYPSDRPNNFAAWRDAIQANVSLIGRFMGAQSGGRRTPRIDMGTSCGPDHVDIQVVPLPLERIHYEDDFDLLEAAVRTQLTHAAGHRRNVVVFADSLSSLPPGQWWGLGSTWLDDRPGAANISNQGDLFSALWIPDGEPLPAPGADGWWPEGMLHEMTHNLGAVQDSAPNASLAGHCTDGSDVMCYDDGGLPFVPGVCAEIEGVMTQVYDCGNDDYFNVSPPAGSYLAMKWNVYDNAYLGSCFALAPACGAEGTAIPNPPVATADPTVQGTAAVGRVLTANTGTWINDPDTWDLQWQVGDGTTWTDVPGATQGSYPVSDLDAGLRLRIQVVATNRDGSTAAYSAPTGVVTGGGGSTGVVTSVPAGTQPLPTGTSLPPVAAAPASGRAALKIAVGKGRGRRLGTVAFSVAAGRLQAKRTKLELPKGRYDVRLCTTAGASTTTPRCVSKRLRVKRARRVATPALSVAVPAGTTGRATYTVTAIGRLFAARTAKRPAVGLLLRG